MTPINWTPSPTDLPNIIIGEPGGYLIEVHRIPRGRIIFCRVFCGDVIRFEIPRIAEAKAFAERHAASRGDRK